MEKADMIALVSMPCSALICPPLAPGLLKARLRKAGMGCCVFYLNFHFASCVGLQDYHLLTYQKSLDPHLAEWLFAAQAWGGDFDMSIDRFIEMADGTPFVAHYKNNAKQRLLHIRDVHVPRFLEQAAGVLLAKRRIKAIGFSCGFYQTNASLALIRRLKSLRPEIPIACGGSSFYGSMGRELISKFDGIDAACLGEADEVIVPLFQSLIQGRDPENLPGILYRNRQGQLCQELAYRPASSRALEENPHPDFDEYFKSLHASGLLKAPYYKSKIFLPMQMSRGCWKGEKQHCTFCGLTDLGLNYRSLSAERAADCVRHLLRRYPVKKISINDLILPKSYYRQLLPRLAEDAEFKGVSFWAEVQTSMPRRNVRLLAEAGFDTLQVGVESLSTHVLTCMHKGVTAIKNIHFLKLCRTYAIHPRWCLLLRVPGERPADYRQMAALIPKIIHLTPPIWGGRPLEMQRFSPYFEQAGRWAVNLRPRPYYAALFPGNRIDLQKVAYFFDADWLDLPENNGDCAHLLDVTKTWIETWSESGPIPLPNLTFENLPDGSMILTDTRLSGQCMKMPLAFDEASLYRAMEDPISRTTLAGLPAAVAMGKKKFEKILDAFVEAGFVLEENRRYLGLALPAGVPEPPAMIRQAMTENQKTRTKEI